MSDVHTDSDDADASLLDERCFEHGSVHLHIVITVSDQHDEAAPILIKCVSSKYLL